MLNTSFKMNKVASIVMVAIEATLIFYFLACTKDDSGTPAEEFNPPSGLKALSKDNNVMLSWNASTSASINAFAGYKIFAKDINDTLIIDSVVDKSVLTFTVNNLVNGEEYIFFVQSVKTNGDTSSAVSLRWGPVQPNMIPKRIYEYDSDSLPGLQFSSGAAFDFVNGNQQEIDLWIDGSGNTPIFLRTPSEVLSSVHGWNRTRFAVTPVSSMDEYVSFPPLESFATDSVSITLNKVYIAYTQDGHYARFQVTGITDDYPNRYIEIVVSYNTGFGAWAKK